MDDGSVVRFRKVAKDYDPTNRGAAWSYLQERQSSGEMHQAAKTVDAPLGTLPFAELCPGNKALQDLQEGYR
jgi:2-oxoglutarate ferredoxin oxidoreductase subunit beta